MRIAVNTRFLLKDNLEGVGYFIEATLRRMVQDHPEDRFLFIFDRPHHPDFLFASNCSAVVIGPPARHPLLWWWWYNYKLPQVVKQFGADVLVSPDGFCSLRTKIPQCLVVHDLSFIHYPQFMPKSHRRFYKKFTPKFLRQARVIATVSAFSKEDIMQQYNIQPHKIKVVYSAARPIFQPSGWEEKKQVREQYTGGKEYFLYVGAVHPRKNLVNLLKGFSAFKKRMQSNMKLIIAGRMAWMNDEFTALLQTFKFRNDVQLLGYLPEEDIRALTAAAYAVVYPSYFEGFGVPIVEAMQSGVPVISSNAASLPEIGGNAALYADPDDPEAIGDQMMLVYKDETLRGQMIARGLQQATLFTWDKTATLLREAIVQAVEG
jgi:glycosyltransferase involved in cell wall biosynthesis